MCRWTSSSGCLDLLTRGYAATSSSDPELVWSSESSTSSAMTSTSRMATRLLPKLCIRPPRQNFRAGVRMIYWRDCATIDVCGAARTQLAVPLVCRWSGPLLSCKMTASFGAPLLHLLRPWATPWRTELLRLSEVFNMNQGCAASSTTSWLAASATSQHGHTDVSLRCASS